MVISQFSNIINSLERSRVFFLSQEEQKNWIFIVFRWIPYLTRILKVVNYTSKRLSLMLANSDIIDKIVIIKLTGFELN